MYLSIYFFYFWRRWVFMLHAGFLPSRRVKTPPLCSAQVAAVSHGAEPRLQSLRRAGSVVATRGLWSVSSVVVAALPHGGSSQTSGEPVCLALQGGVLTSGLPGKPLAFIFNIISDLLGFKSTILWCSFLFVLIALYIFFPFDWHFLYFFHSSHPVNLEFTSSLVLS